MKRLSIVCLAVASVSLSAQASVPKELQGTWALTQITGKVIPTGLYVSLVITGDQYYAAQNGKVDERGTIKVDATKTPWLIDFAIAEGTHAGKIQVGLTQVSGDTLTMALGEPGSTTRPANVDQSLVLSRIKPLPAELAGAWEGMLVTSTGQQLALVFKLTNGADGLATGTLVSVDQGAKEGPITGVLVTGSKVKLIIPAVRGAYEGELKDHRLTGTWSQGAGALPLVLTRAK